MDKDLWPTIEKAKKENMYVTRVQVREGKTRLLAEFVGVVG